MRIVQIVQLSLIIAVDAHLLQPTGSGAIIE
jgi:hypothetical protein